MDAREVASAFTILRILPGKVLYVGLWTMINVLAMNPHPTMAIVASDVVSSDLSVLQRSNRRLGPFPILPDIAYGAFHFVLSALEAC